jgi:preprotein translocase subunit SecA
LVNFLIYEEELWHEDSVFEQENQEILAKMKKTPLISLSGTKKLGRNDLCPCGSGKKYKRCCG